MSDSRPIVTLTVGNIKTLAEVEKWAAIAAAIAMPSQSTVTVDGVHDAVSVTAYLVQVPSPEEADRG